MKHFSLLGWIFMVCLPVCQSTVNSCVAGCSGFWRRNETLCSIVFRSVRTVGSFTYKFWFAKCNTPQKWTNFARVEVFTSVLLWIQAFWDVILLCWLSGFWHFNGLQFLHFQVSSICSIKMKALQNFRTLHLHSVTSQKIWILQINFLHCVEGTDFSLLLQKLIWKF